jgi:hypothetical protein
MHSMKGESQSSRDEGASNKARGRLSDKGPSKGPPVVVFLLSLVLSITTNTNRRTAPLRMRRRHRRRHWRRSRGPELRRLGPRRKLDVRPETEQYPEHDTALAGGAAELPAAPPGLEPQPEWTDTGCGLPQRQRRQP